MTAKNDEAYRRIGTGNQHKDHHVIDSLEDAQALAGDIDCVIGGAGAVKQNHTDDKDDHGCKILAAVRASGLDQKWYSCKCCQHHRDKMSDGAARFSDCYLHTNPPFVAEKECFRNNVLKTITINTTYIIQQPDK